MPALKSPFLLIGHWPEKLKDIGAVFFDDLTQASKADVDFEVLGLSVTSLLEKKFDSIWKDWKKQNPFAQILLICSSDYSANNLVSLHHKYHFYSMLTDMNDPQAENNLYLALEKVQELKQEQNLELLIQEQNQSLSSLYKDLEDRVDKRTKYLTEARQKLFITNSRIETLRKTVQSIYEAKSVAEIESQLNASLNVDLKTSWIRILFSPQDEIFQKQVGQQLQFHQLQVPLFSQDRRIGSLFFMRSPQQSFQKEETDFLNRLAETVSLALDRLGKIEELGVLKEQWESTFDAILDPVALISENYDIIQANKSFMASNPPSSSKKCYEVLFGHNSPCKDCKRGQNFQLSSEKPKSTYQVTSQRVRLEDDKKNAYIHFYKNISENLKMEKQILDSARRAELGTISSSIAHELNNPLGGILTYTQLIKMDLDSRDPIYPDIVEIEKGALRCRDIIQNMLIFTRNPEVDEIQEIDLAEVLQRAFKIMELQTKSLGIEIQLIQPVPVKKFRGHRNLLAQAFKNLLQISLDNMKGDRTQNKILIRMVNTEMGTDVILSPFCSSEKNMNSSQTYSWSLATQIFQEQNAQLEILATSSLGFGAKISFSRPVLRA